MPVIWRDEMAVGNTEIDNDHKYLISLINVVETALNIKFRDKVLLSHISELHIYAKEHFAKEEKIQDEIKYPDNHNRKHGNLLKQLTQIHDSLKTPINKEFYNATIKNLFEVLKDWLLIHVLNEDMKMKPYFNKRSLEIKSPDARKN